VDILSFLIRYSNGKKAGQNPPRVVASIGEEEEEKGGGGGGG